MLLTRILVFFGTFASVAGVSLLRPSTRLPKKIESAEMFAPGIVSTRDYEKDGTFSPDGDTFYYTKRTMWPYFSTICVSHFINGNWSDPEVASFSGQYSDGTPFVSPDGERLYFASRRPAPGSDRPGTRIWVAERVSNGWSSPQVLPDSINGQGGVINPVEVRDGSLYFLRANEGRVYVARRKDGTWLTPEAVGEPNEPGTTQVGVYVDPDERFMLISIVGRSDAVSTKEGIYARSDLYARERTGSAWSPLRHLDAPINSAAEDFAPTVSPDGRFLYFTSERGVFTEHGTQYDYAGLERALHAPGNGLGDIYRVDFNVTGIKR